MLLRKIMVTVKKDYIEIVWVDDGKSSVLRPCAPTSLSQPPPCSEIITVCFSVSCANKVACVGFHLLRYRSVRVRVILWINQCFDSVWNVYFILELTYTTQDHVFVVESSNKNTWNENKISSSNLFIYIRIFTSTEANIGLQRKTRTSLIRGVKKMKYISQV